MSSYLFYSSPPSAVYSRYSQQASFFTPQAHRTNPLSPWPSFQPESPSPLRSSNHANIMRSSPLTKTSHVERAEDDLMRDENASPSTPFLSGPNTNACTNTNASQSNSIDVTRNPFQFQQRARESSAQHQLSGRVAANRADRKSAFINRLRRSRRDDRDNRGIDSFEKAEYWRERKAKEARLLSEAERLGVDIDAGELGDLLEEAEAIDEGQLSPVSEEREVEELVNAYLEEQKQTHGHKGAHDEFMDDSFEDDDSYDKVFAELLSQEQKTQPPWMGSTAQSRDGDVDMS